MTTSTSINDPLTISQRPVERSHVSRPEIVPLWPQWFPTIDLKMRRLARLGDNWDGYGGSPIDHETLIFSIDVLGQFLRPSLPEPQIVPTPHGGLQFEWHTNGVDLEIEVREPYAVGIYFEDSRTPNEAPLDYDVTTFDRASVERIVSRLITV